MSLPASIADFPALSDAELLEQFHTANSQSAFRQLVQRYQAMVVGTALRRTRREDLARDVAQEVFTSLARKARSLLGRASLGGWLHQAAVYEAAHLLQAETRRSVRQERFSQERFALSEPAGPVPLSEGAEVLDEVLEVLSEGDREAIVLHYFQDLSYPEMATRLGASEPAIRQRVSRAVERLGQRLRERGVTKHVWIVLTGAIAIQATNAAPVGLAQAALAAAAAGVAKTGGLGSAAKWALAAGLALLGGGTLWYERAEVAPPEAAVPAATLAGLPPPERNGPFPVRPQVAIERPISREAETPQQPPVEARAEAPAGAGGVAGAGFGLPVVSRAQVTGFAPVAKSGSAAMAPVGPVVAANDRSRAPVAARSASSSNRGPESSSASVLPPLEDLLPTLPGPLGEVAATEGLEAALARLRLAELLPPEAAALYSDLLTGVLNLTTAERNQVEQVLQNEFSALGQSDLGSALSPVNLSETVSAQRGELASTVAQTVQEVLPAKSNLEVVKEVLTVVEKPVATVSAPAEKVGDAVSAVTRPVSGLVGGALGGLRK